MKMSFISGSPNFGKNLSDRIFKKIQIDRIFTWKLLDR